MAAVLAKGRTVIRNAASEPHVQQLGMALLRMGARMIGVGTNTITIDGVESLKGIEHTILGDHMEVGSLVGAVAMTHGEVTIKNAVTQHLRMTRLVFKRLGVQTEIRGDDLVVKAGDRYVIEHDIGGAIPKVESQGRPGLPSDLTSVPPAMATQAHGTALIPEWRHPGGRHRPGSLQAMGAGLGRCDP